MNFRLTAIIFGLVTLLVAVLLLVMILDSDDSTPTGVGLVPALTSAGLKPADVDTVEIVRAGAGTTEETLVFVRSDKDGWKATRPVKARVNGTEIDEIVRALFTTTPFPHPDLTGNLNVHGLDHPTIRVTLKAGADASAGVNFGLTTIGRDRAVTFVTMSAKPNRALAVRRADLAPLFREAARDKDGPASALMKWLPDYRERELFGSTMRDATLQVQSVKLSTAGKELAMHNDKGTWAFDLPANYGQADIAGSPNPANPSDPFSGVRPLLNMLTALRVEKGDDFIEQPGDLAQYGLDPANPNRIRVEMVTVPGEPVRVLELGKMVPLAPNAPPTSPQVYGRMEGDPAVFKLAAGRVEALRATITTPSALREKDLIAQARRAEIDALDLVIGKQTLSLRKMPVGAAHEWVLYGGPSGPVAVRGPLVEQLLTELTKPRNIQEVFDQPRDYAFAPGEVKATVKLWFHGLDKPEKGEAGKLPPEPKLQGTPMELTLGKVEMEKLFVRKTADGATLDATLPATLLPLVNRSRLDLIDPQLPSFSAKTVGSFSFNRGKELFTLTQSKEVWSFTNTASRKDLNADTALVASLVGSLGNLFNPKLVTEQPTPEQLKAWGLEAAAPRMKVSFTLTDEGGPVRSFLLGNPSEDKNLSYAMCVGKPFVFLIPTTTYSLFANTILIDKTLFTLDPKKVTAVQFRGWADLLGDTPPYYVAKRDGEKWIGEKPAGFAPDPAKMEKLLKALSAPKAERYAEIQDVPKNGGLPFGSSKKRMEIAITIEGRDDPLYFILGNDAPEGRVYATTSRLQNIVFTYDPKEIQGMLEKPKSLEK